jgi:hypothetical protein
MYMSKRAKLAILLVPLAALCGVLFVHDAAKGLVLSTWYRPKVTSNFNHDFDAINPRLLNYGITFEQRNTKKDCDARSGYPSGGKSVFTCSIYARTKVVADEAFVKKWRQTSPELEKYLLSEGWRKENKDQPLNEILDNFNRDSSIAVHYRKAYGCRLTLSWVLPETPNHLDVTEVCEVAQRTWGL